MSNLKNNFMITDREDANSYMIDFADNEDWEGFDKIVLKLTKEFNAIVIEKNDGPESRVWRLEIEGIPLSLHNNPYGNYLKASSPESISYLKETIDKFRIVFY
jgi:hypothetical protein